MFPWGHFFSCLITREVPRYPPTGLHGRDCGICVLCKFFHVPSLYLYEPRKTDIYDWENKFAPSLKIRTQIYVPMDNIYMSQACGHDFMLSFADAMVAGANTSTAIMRIRHRPVFHELYHVTHIYAVIKQTMDERGLKVDNPWVYLLSILYTIDKSAVGR